MGGRQAKLKPRLPGEPGRCFPVWRTVRSGLVTVPSPRLDLVLRVGQLVNQCSFIYGSPRIHRDLREAGMLCGKKRVARLMQVAKLRSVRG